MKIEDINKLITYQCQWIDTVNEEGIGELQKFSFNYEESYTNLKGISIYTKQTITDDTFSTNDCDVYLQYENSELELCETLEDVKDYFENCIFWYIEESKEHLTMTEELRYISKNITKSV